MRLLLLLILLFSALFSEYLDNYEDTMQKAKESHKIPAIMIVKSHCPWCSRMKENTLIDPEIQTILNKHFVLGIIDQHSGDAPDDICSTFVPTTHFLDYSGDVIWQSIGYKNKGRFLIDINEVLKMWKEFDLAK